MCQVENVINNQFSKLNINIEQENPCRNNTFFNGSNKSMGKFFGLLASVSRRAQNTHRMKTHSMSLDLSWDKLLCKELLLWLDVNTWRYNHVKFIQLTDIEPSSSLQHFVSNLHF